MFYAEENKKQLKWTNHAVRLTFRENQRKKLSHHFELNQFLSSVIYPAKWNFAGPDCLQGSKLRSKALISARFPYGLLPVSVETVTIALSFITNLSHIVLACICAVSPLAHLK